MARSALIGHAQGQVTGTAVATTAPIDTTGATALYIFGSTTFTIGEPAGGYDNFGNTWVIIGDPNSTCNGSIIGLRCFNPITGPGHVFRISGSPSFSTYVAVLALKVDSPGGVYLLTRSANQANPVQPGSMTPPSDNAVIVCAAQAGCGWLGPPTVDSGFTMVEAVGNLGVAYQVQPAAAPINPTWSSLAPGGIGGSTGCSVAESMSLFPPFGGGLRVYEA